jgi:hypothetical protein
VGGGLEEGGGVDETGAGQILKRFSKVLSSIMYFLARHIKAELGSEMLQLGFREYYY